MFESGAILIYLAEKTGRLMPADAKGRSLRAAVADVPDGRHRPDDGPGQRLLPLLPREDPARHRPLPGRGASACSRCSTVSSPDNEFLAGDYSIADIANWAWVRTSKWSGVPFDDLPHLTRWVDQIRQRPAVQAGILMPPSKLSGAEDDTEKARKFVEEARKMVVTGGPELDSE